jgi:hypothetical protein
MAIVKMLKRVANPRRKSSTSSSRARTSGGKFATAKRRTTTTRRRKSTQRTTATRNPALLVTLGAVNPYKRKKTVAKSKRRTRRTVNPRRKAVSRRRRRNTATKIVVMAPKRRNPRRRVMSRRRRSNPSIRRRRTFRRRSNPTLMGMSVTSSQALKMIAGGLVGVTATKTLTAMLPAQFVSSPILRIVASGAVAFLSGMLVGRMDSSFGSAVAFGGYMQTGSLALNTLVPSIGSRLSLGELVPGSFPLPQNPIRAGGMLAAPARVTTNGLNRAYTPAY